MLNIRERILPGVAAIIMVLGGWFSPVPAQAVPILDFSVGAPAAGTISYAGGPAGLVGTGISVDTLVGLDTPSNNLVSLTCYSCTLTFTTGGLTGSTSSEWDFSAGGSIALIGGVDLDGGGIGAGDIPLGSTLLSGSFVGTSAVLAFGPTFKIAGASFFDTMSGLLTDFYGLPSGSYAGNFNLSFSAAGSPPSAFKSVSVLSGDITNSSVPEPSALLLLGSGLVGLGFWGRKRLKGGQIVRPR